MPIKWEEEQLSDPNNDLCTRIAGVYADIVQNLHGQWSCLWDTSNRYGPFTSREAAIAWFDLAVENLSKGMAPELPAAANDLVRERANRG